MTPDQSKAIPHGTREIRGPGSREEDLGNVNSDLRSLCHQNALTRDRSTTVPTLLLKGHNGIWTHLTRVNHRLLHQRIHTLSAPLVLRFLRIISTVQYSKSSMN